MRVRGTQKAVKPVEVNVDTVYVRTNIVRVTDENFEGWEYDEETYTIKEYLEKIANADDLSSIATLVSILISEIDYLRSRIEALEGGSV